MKVFELIAQLQQFPTDADVHIGWTEVNDSGTAYDTGCAASVVEPDGWKQDNVSAIVIR
jgi:hypothetical protein